MPQLYQSPIERLVALGKAVPVPETEVKLVAHMKKHYVPAAIQNERDANTRATEFRRKFGDIPLS